MNHSWLIIVILLPILSCTGKKARLPTHTWELGEKVLSSNLLDSLENVAVKDPSIVFHNGQYHLFYSARSVQNEGDDISYNICCRQRSASTLESLADAIPITMDDMAGCRVIAPQVFFFEPDSLWYLLAHTLVKEGRYDKLSPIYMTNPDIGDPDGWSRAKEILTGVHDEEFWIDFWLICDDQYAWLFYADQKGSLYRLKSGLTEFPEGFTESTHELALHLNSMGEDGGWQFFEAAHIYYVKEEKSYLAILEGAYPHPEKKGIVDSRNRFIFGMATDSLDGTWRRIERREELFLADVQNITLANGQPHNLTQVSHPELVRSGYNQRLEISSYKLEMIFQSFDGSVIPDGYHYAALPWELYIMNNYRE